MASADGGAYSYSLTVFSPSGKLVQIEHALAAVSQGTTSLGIKGLSSSRPYYILDPQYSASFKRHRNSHGEEILINSNRRLHAR